MNLPEIEKKWQKRWEETGLYKFDKNSDKPKQYVLEMFSYPLSLIHIWVLRVREIHHV